MNQEQRLHDMLKLRLDPLEGGEEELSHLVRYEINSIEDMVDFTVKLMEIYSVATTRINIDLRNAMARSDELKRQLSDSPFEGLVPGDERRRKYSYSENDVKHQMDYVYLDADARKGQVVKRFGEELNSESIDIRTEDLSIVFSLDQLRYKFKFVVPLEGIVPMRLSGIWPIKFYKENENATPLFLISSINYLYPS